MRKGFTLIEILVVVAVLGVIMTTVVGVLLNTFKAKNRTDVTNRLEQSGSYLIMELRRQVLNAHSSGISCPETGIGSSMVLVNKFDGKASSIECLEFESLVASKSMSGTFNLSGTDVGVSGCNRFVSCDTLPSSGEVGTINFNFSLFSSNGGDTPDSYVRRAFENKVVVRNY